MRQEILGTVFVSRIETLEGFIKRQEPDKEGVILVLGVETDFLKSIVHTIKDKTSRDVASGNFNNSFNKNKWQELLQKGTFVDGEEKKVCAVVIVVSSASHNIGASVMSQASNRVFDNYASEMAAVLSQKFNNGGVIIIRET